MKKYTALFFVLIASLTLTSCNMFRLVKVSPTEEAEESNLEEAIAQYLTQQASQEAPPVAEPTLVPTDVPATPEPAEPQQATPASNEPLSPTEEASYSGEMKFIEAGNMSLKLPTEVAYTVDVAWIPGIDDGGGLPDSWSPPHRLVTFTNYRIQHHFHTPEIYVYPKEELIDRGSPRSAALDSLIQLLDNPGRDLRAEQSLPFLPVFNAAQLFHVLEERISSEHSSGIRYLTLYSQAYVGVTDYELFYTYQGLTSDGKYYIAAVLPINSDLLSDQEPSSAEMETIIANYDAYLTPIIAMLNGDGGASLTPPLAALDAMMLSISVQD